MNKEDKIKHEISEIWYTLLTAKNAFYYAEHLYCPPTQKEKDYMRHYGVELLFFRTVLWRYSVIEISKLFRASEKRSIKKFLNNVRGGGKFSKIVPNELVIKWDNKLFDEKNLIDKVITLRDEVFAHTDIDYKETRQYDNFESEVETLIILVQEFISDIFLVFNSSALQPGKLLKDNFEIVNILADYEDKKYNDIIDEYKKLAEKYSQ